MAVSCELTVLEYALALARLCWPVAPAHTVRDGRCSCGAKCSSPGKHPRTEHGLKDATLDEEQIREWWRKWPDANVLIRTGRSGDRSLVVLDVDPRHSGDESLATLEARHGLLPRTPRTKTGGGGEHIFFWSSEEVGSSVRRLGDGLDVRAEGGYVIGPGSRHQSGGLYEWTVGPDVRLAEAPEWLVKLAGKTRKRTSENPPTYIKGGRNNALASLAGSMRHRGMSQEAIEAALLVENDLKCEPPIDPKEVQTIARSVAGYAPDNPPPEGDIWNLLSAKDLATLLPPIPWLCEPLAIAPGAVTLVGGYGFSGKTVALQSFALSVAAGRSVWGTWSCRSGPVVHLDYEQGRRVTQERYQRLAHSMGISLAEIPLAVSCLPRIYLDEKGVEAALVDLCSGRALMIDDSFRASFPTADENDSKVRKHLDMLTRVSERTGCTIVVILHARKPSKDSAEGAKFSLRGSSAIFDAAQTILVFHGEKGAPTRVEHEKCRIRGATLTGFGLLIEDTDGKSGLAVRQMEPEQLAELAHVQASKKNSENAARAENLIRKRLTEIGMKFIGSREQFLDFLGGDRNTVSRTLTVLVQKGLMLDNGRGSERVWTMDRYSV